MAHRIPLNASVIVAGLLQRHSYKADSKIFKNNMLHKYTGIKPQDKTSNLLQLLFKSTILTTGQLFQL